MPQALPYIYIVAMAAGTAATMYATDTQAKQQESNLKYQSAQTAADAKAAQGEAEVEAMRIRKAAQVQKSQMTAAAAASGIDVNSPTAVRLDEEVTHNSEEDALLTILGGKDRSSRMNNQAMVDRQGASLARTEGRAQETGTLLSAVSSSYTSTGGWKTAG
jgi:predicted secreted acid phosphatase